MIGGREDRDIDGHLLVEYIKSIEYGLAFSTDEMISGIQFKIYFDLHRHNCRIIDGFVPGIVVDTNEVLITQLLWNPAKHIYSEFTKPSDLVDREYICGKGKYAWWPKVEVNSLHELESIFAKWYNTNKQMLFPFNGKRRHLHHPERKLIHWYHSIQQEHPHFHIAVVDLKKTNVTGIDAWSIEKIVPEFNALELTILTLGRDINNSMRKFQFRSAWYCRHNYDIPLPISTVKKYVSEKVWDAYLFLILMMGYGEFIHRITYADEHGDLQHEDYKLNSVQYWDHMLEIRNNPYFSENISMIENFILANDVLPVSGKFYYHGWYKFIKEKNIPYGYAVL